jgi:sugar/nucleoside kinase (ribokinase family)
MSRLLAVGHVTWDRRDGEEVLGGTVSYAALAARKLGWDAAVLTSAGPEFEPERALPGIPTFVHRASATTRFRNVYDSDGARRQEILSRAEDIETLPLAEGWRGPDALLLGPVAGEIGPGLSTAFEAGVVGAVAQGWLRAFDGDGRVVAKDWDDASRALLGVHVLFLSEQDMPDAESGARELLSFVPMILLTRGWRGATLISRDGTAEIPTLPRPEVDPTGAGDVFAASFLVRYHETGDPEAAAAFGACSASCSVEGVGTTALGTREEVERRLVLRQRLIEEGEWDE